MCYKNAFLVQTFIHQKLNNKNENPVQQRHKDIAYLATNSSNCSVVSPPTIQHVFKPSPHRYNNGRGQSLFTPIALRIPSSHISHAMTIFRALMAKTLTNKRSQLQWQHRNYDTPSACRQSLRTESTMSTCYTHALLSR